MRRLILPKNRGGPTGQRELLLTKLYVSFSGSIWNRSQLDIPGPEDPPAGYSYRRHTAASKKWDSKDTSAMTQTEEAMHMTTPICKQE